MEAAVSSAKQDTSESHTSRVVEQNLGTVSLSDTPPHLPLGVYGRWRGRTEDLQSSLHCRSWMVSLRLSQREASNVKESGEMECGAKVR